MATPTWYNWAGNQHSDARVVAPTDLKSLKEVVKRTAAKGRRMRAVGGGYSWSELVPVSERDTIIKTTKLNRLIAIDERDCTVTVECGMTIDDLTQRTARKGLTLFTPTIYPYPTIGGMVAVGAHGTDINTGNFSDQICEMTFILPDGSERTISEQDADFHAAQIALGALGIMYSVKLRVEPDFPVYVDERQVPVRYVLEELDDLIHSYDFAEVFWYPLQDYMWLFLMHPSRSPADQTTWLSRKLAELQDRFELVIGEVALPRIVRRAPGLTPALTWAASSLGREVNQSVLLASQAFHFQKTYVKNWDLAYAVPSQAGTRAWQDAITLVEEYARAGRYPCNLAVHCRFTGASQAWLAPNYKTESCIIEAVTALETQDYKGFFDELEDRWLSIPGARPHWAKVFGRPLEIAARYPKMKDFLDVRQKWDPDRVFLNRFLEEKIFQL